VSVDLEGSILSASNWELAACRIDHAYDVDFSPDGSGLVIGSGNGTLSSWDWKGMTRKGRIALHTDYVFDMAVDPVRSRWAFTTWDGFVHMHDCTDGRRVWSIDGEGAGHGRLAFSSGGEYLAAGSWEGRVRMWRCGHAPEEARSWHVEGRINCLAFHPSNEYVLAAGDGLYRLSPKGQAQAVGGRTGRQGVGGSRGPGGGIEAAAFHPAGTPVALSNWQNHSLTLIDGESGRTIGDVSVPVWNVYALAFSPSGALLAVGGERGIALVDLSTGKVQSLHDRSLTGDRESVKRIRFSPDGNILVSAGFDGVARIWHVPSRTELVAIDVGIQCYGADITGSKGFDGLSVRLWADWEEWWTGPALRERFQRCGAIDHHSASPRACWDGTDHRAWLTHLNWADEQQAFRARHGRELTQHEARHGHDFFAGAARGHIM
jgi:WD40 repeat protein